MPGNKKFLKVTNVTRGEMLCFVVNYRPIVSKVLIPRFICSKKRIDPGSTVNDKKLNVLCSVLYHENLIDLMNR